MLLFFFPVFTGDEITRAITIRDKLAPKESPALLFSIASTRRCFSTSVEVRTVYFLREVERDDGLLGERKWGREGNVEQT